MSSTVATVTSSPDRCKDFTGIAKFKIAPPVHTGIGMVVIVVVEPVVVDVIVMVVSVPVVDVAVVETLHLSIRVV